MIATPLRMLCLAGAAVLLPGCASLLSWDDGPKNKGGGKWTTVFEAEGQKPPQPTRAIGADEHFVRKGDTVYSIAFRNSLDFRELARWNGIGSDYLIFPGQVLRLAPPQPPAPKPIQTDDIESQGMPMDHEVAPPRPVTAESPPPPEPVEAEAALTPLPGEIVEPTGFEWTWPTHGIVIRGYAPAEGSKGLDFAGLAGQPIFAAAPGRVVYSGNALKGYGELIIIKHDDIHLSAYGYNRKRHVDEGDIVTAGQPIGEMGVGPENKPLLHFEIRERGKPTNPAKLLPGRVQATAP